MAKKNSSMSIPGTTSPYLETFYKSGQADAWAKKQGYSFEPNPKKGLVMVGQIQAPESYFDSGSKGVSQRQATRNVYGPGAQAAAPGPAGAGAGGAAADKGKVPSALKEWNQSIDQGTQSMMDSIAKMISENQATTNLFMGTIGDLMKQINSAPQRKAVAPYAVTTEEVGAMAPNAQTSQTVTARPRPRNNSLTIAPETQAMGTGLNIAI